MPIEKTKGIVLRSQKWMESSRIVTICTEDFGKIKAVAKGARRLKNKFGASLEPITHGSFVFYRTPHGQLHTLDEGWVISWFTNLKSDLKKFFQASFFCELTDWLAPLEQRTGDFYQLLLEALCAVEDAPPNSLQPLLWSFQLQILTISGYHLEMSRCSSCGLVPKKGPVSFSLPLGGLLCENCLAKDENAMQIHLGTAKLLSELQRRDLKGVRNLGAPHSLTREIQKILSVSLRYHAGDSRRLKTVDFLPTD